MDLVQCSGIIHITRKSSMTFQAPACLKGFMVHVP